MASYTKAQVDALLQNFYTKAEVDELLAQIRPVESLPYPIPFTLGT